MVGDAEEMIVNVYCDVYNKWEFAIRSKRSGKPIKTIVKSVKTGRKRLITRSS